MNLSNLKSRGRLIQLSFALMISVATIFTNGCEGLSWNETRSAQIVRKNGEVRVALLNDPLVTGLDQDLLKNFAQTYDLKVRFIPVKTAQEADLALINNKADISAAREWLPHQKDGMISGPTLEESHLSLFCNRHKRIRKVKDLSGKKVAIRSKDNVEEVDARIRQFAPTVALTIFPESSGREVLRSVWHEQNDCAIIEDVEGTYYRRGFGAINKVADITDQQPIGWMIRSDRKDLSDLLSAWFKRASREDEIMRVQDLDRGQINQLARYDIHRFVSDMKSNFPQYSKAFHRAASEQDLDWTLIAAVAYQESQWKSEARSHTGVRGLMQLTEGTAGRVGIADREDPLQSISGGASYLKTLIDLMPATMDSKERIELALAAYNSGIAHLKDAQALAVKRGLNPLSWRNLKKVYPLLENKDIASSLPAGPARGRETVQFVERVRAYRDLFGVL